MTRLRDALGSLASFALVGAIFTATACGDVYAEPDGQNIPIPRGDASLAALPKDVPIFCPSSRPNENTFCQAEGSTCEFGESPDMQCNKTFACTADATGNFWLERSTDRCLKSMCPAEPADIATLDGQPCSVPATDAGPPPSDADEAVCPMTNGTCACTTGPDGAHSHERRWVCILASGNGCPVARPLAGDNCGGSLWCDYGSCKWKRGLLMQCKDGHWLTGGAPCN